MSVDVVPVDVLYIVVGAVRIADDTHVYSFAGI